MLWTTFGDSPSSSLKPSESDLAVSICLVANALNPGNWTGIDTLEVENRVHHPPIPVLHMPLRLCGGLPVHESPERLNLSLPQAANLIACRSRYEIAEYDVAMFLVIRPCLSSLTEAETRGSVFVEGLGDCNRKAPGRFEFNHGALSFVNGTDNAFFRGNPSISGAQILCCECVTLVKAASPVPGTMFR